MQKSANVRVDVILRLPPFRAFQTSFCFQYLAEKTTRHILLLLFVGTLCTKIDPVTLQENLTEHHGISCQQ